MKKFIFIILIFSCMIVLSGCPPKEHPDMNLIMNKMFGEVHIEEISTYQEELDYLVLKIDHQKTLESLYISGNSLDIIKGTAFGYELEKVTIENRDFINIDLNELEVEDNESFLLILSFPKDSIYQNIYYEEIVKSEIVAHSFDIYINYDQESIQNYRFFLDASNGPEYELERKILLYNNIDDFLEDNDYYHNLYLPHINDQVTALSKEIVYYPNYEHHLFLNNNKFNLVIWRSDSGVVYGDQEKTIYEYNGMSFSIITHKAYQRVDYSIDFVISENEKIQYHYLIEDSNIDEIISFIKSIKSIN